MELKRNHKRTLAFLLTALSYAAPLCAGDWPMFKRDAARTGYAREQVYPPLTPAWSFEDVQGEIRSSPVVVGDIVLFGSRDGSVWAFNAVSGALLWQYNTDGYVDASPAVADETVYVPSVDGKLYAFDLNNGEDPLWTYSTGYKDMSSPVVYGGKVYWTTGFPGKYLIAVDAATGVLAWQRDIDQNSQSSPALEGGVIAAGTNDGKIVAYDAATGTPKWNYQTTGRVEFSSLAGDGQGYFYGVAGGDDPNLYAWNAQTGALKAGFPVALVDLSAQSFGQPASEVSSVVVAAGKVYVAMTGVTAPDTVDLQLFCRNASDGSQAWAPQVIGDTPQDLGYASTPAVANDVLYIGSGDGKLYMFNALTGSPLGTVDLGSPIVASPAAANGKVFVGSIDGKFRAYQAQQVAAIQSPTDGETVGGIMDVSGIVSSPNFQNYTLEYGEGASPVSWTSIVSGQTSQVPAAATLGTWNAMGFDSSTYTLRLTVSLSGGSPPLSTAYATVSLDAKYKRMSVAAASGGTLVTSDSTTLTIAAGGLNMNSVVTLRAGALMDGDIPPSSVATGQAREILLRAAGASFSQPATLTIPYEDADVSGMTQTALRIFLWNGSAWTALESSTPDAAAKTVSASVSAPGIYRIFEYELATQANFKRSFVNAGLGGTLTASDGTTLTIPASALNQNDYVTIFQPAIPVAPVPDGAEGTSIAREFAFDQDATKLLTAATFTVPYADAEVANIDPGFLRPFFWDGSSWTLMGGSTVDTAAKTVTFVVSKPGIYRLMEYRVIGTDQDMVYVSPEGAEVMVASGTFSQSDFITITKLTGGEPMSVALPQPLLGLPEAWEFKTGRSDTVFKKPVTIRLPYRTADLNNAAPERLRIYLWYPDEKLWRIVNNSAVDKTAQKIGVQVSHFSVYRAVLFQPGGGLLEKDKVYTYPNPATGQTVTFKTYLGDDADVTIEVYNVAGEKIAHLTNRGTGGNVLETVWDAGRIASGVYVYRVEAKSASGARAEVTKKLAIVH